MQMTELIKSSGPAGIMVIIAAATLLVAGVVMIALSLTRKAFALYLVAAWIPLLIGAAGTRVALDEMERSPLTQSEAIGPRNQKRVRAELRRPLNMGIVASGILVPVALFGLVSARRRP